MKLARRRAWNVTFWYIESAGLEQDRKLSCRGVTELMVMITFLLQYIYSLAVFASPLGMAIWAVALFCMPCYQRSTCVTVMVPRAGNSYLTPLLPSTYPSSAPLNHKPMGTSSYCLSV